MALSDSELQAIVEMLDERNHALNQARNLERAARKGRRQGAIKSARRLEREAKYLREHYRVYSPRVLANKFEVSREYIYRIGWRYGKVQKRY